MRNPDYSKIFPKRFITMSMADKVMAVCFIYDGIQYQNLCREEGPDGTFNYSEKCLSSLPYRFPFIGTDANTSLSNENSLIRYTGQEQQEFPDILSAIQHYWIQVLMLCIISGIAFHLCFLFLRRQSSRYSSFFNPKSSSTFVGNGRSNGHNSDNFNTRLPTVNAKGNISIGKISFDRNRVLGLGSKGTCVFKGQFEKSLDCAVKRVVSQHLTLADREVDFLRSLQHANLVRYLATEEDAQFIYIALELAEFTLANLVESGRVEEIGLTITDLCLQSASGLQHLHKLDIVHRDIKPQNILISFPQRPNETRKVMISDFGLSKQLSTNNVDSGHTSSAMRYFDGTQGWMAPEIVNAKLSEDRTLSPNKSADIFSLGCVFYYILSNGRHPFGEMDARQMNILKDNNLLDKFNMLDHKSQNLNLPEDRLLLATKLIRSMVQPSPEQRPPIGSVLMYPFFWSNGDQLQFLQDVSDRIDKEEKDSEIITRVERDRRKVIAFGWKDCLSKELQDDLGSFRKYNERLISHLLRAIRNKKHHYRESSQELRKSLGELPDEFMNYFSLRFPELIPHVYEAMQTCRSEGIFQRYYDQIDEFAFI